MKSTADALQFGQLRARIEAMFSEPSLFVITSAGRGDGKTATAFGLAKSLADADHRVLLIDANAEAPVLPQPSRIANLSVFPDFSNLSRYATPVAGERFYGLSLADERFVVGTSIEKVRAAAFDLRSHFAYVVIDTGPLTRSDLAVLFAAIADGTLLTLRLGRFASAADEVTIKTLTRVGANVLGVLTVSQSMIRAFPGQREERSATLRFPIKHMTSRHTREPESARETVESKLPNIVS